MIKKTTFICLLLGLGFIFACEPEEVDPLVLSLDGGNESSPFFDANVSQEAAVQFPASMMANHTDKRITTVDCFIATVPTSLEVKIYGEGTTASSPGTLLHSEVINTANLRSSNTWYTFTLSEAVNITGGDLWVGITVQHNSRAGIIGCDPGPAVSGGDWYNRNTGGYQTFRNFTGGISINWNIRAGMELN